MKYFTLLLCLLLILFVSCENDLLENIDQKIEEDQEDEEKKVKIINEVKGYDEAQNHNR